ncbi:alpha/beta hydrolase [Streptomyces tanashiensis]|uniref:Alpha/beta fold hydrolase n=1 Tax=Streptomyces tanashiensis TaxID=67367 RepID=A0ABY6QX72_9ACTN|nr:alpha/beta fold hydrolase [Streptomyces tanashiensis]UZX21892.1 alpha/beta fold hydrolase [Streptomyces tanashiensis]
MGTETRLPATAAGSTFAAVLLGAGRQIARRRRVLTGRGDEKFLTTGSGNRISFRVNTTTEPKGSDRPLIVFESGFMATMEHWTWISEALDGKESTVFYDRGGYGRSRHGRGRYRTPRPLTPHTVVSDLVDLVRHTRGERRVVLVGHAMGAGIVLRAAAELEDAVAGTVLLEPPAVTAPSGGPRTPAVSPLFVGSMRAGCGDLLPRPSWAGALPEHGARLRDDQYRDARLWEAGRREADVSADLGVHETLLACAPTPLTVVAHRDADLTGYSGLRPAAPHVLDGFRPGRLLHVRPAAERAAAIVSATVERVAATVSATVSTTGERVR